MREPKDFVVELRADVAHMPHHPYTADLLTRAADEIERLREQVTVQGLTLANRVARIGQMREALDKIIGVALGRADFPAAMVHRIAHDALGLDEQKAPER